MRMATQQQRQSCQAFESGWSARRNCLACSAELLHLPALVQACRCTRKTKTPTNSISTSVAKGEVGGRAMYSYSTIVGFTGDAPMLRSVWSLLCASVRATAPVSTCVRTWPSVCRFREYFSL
jgi:hypothetical protein